MIAPGALPISDPDDPGVVPYRALRQRDAVSRREGFVAEGEVVLAKAVRAGRYPLSSVLIDERRLAKLAPVLAELGPSTPVYSATQAVLESICGFPLHRGVLAHGAAPALPDAASLLASLGPEAVVLVIVGVGDAENMGALFRNAAAFGADAALLDTTACDPLYRRAIRVSVGAALLTPFARAAAGEDLLALLRGQGFEPLALSPSGALCLEEVRPTSRMALLVGSEGPGLPAALLSGAKSVRIDMAAGVDSLNVATATASGIALHHLRVTRRRREVE